jgi:hypothetical protein
MCTEENQPMRERRLFEQSSELLGLSKKQAETLYLFFSLTRQAKNLLTIWLCTETPFNFIGLQKNVHLVTRSF